MLVEALEQRVASDRARSQLQTHIGAQGCRQVLQGLRVVESPVRAPHVVVVLAHALLHGVRQLGVRHEALHVVQLESEALEGLVCLLDGEGDVTADVCQEQHADDLDGDEEDERGDRVGVGRLDAVAQRGQAPVQHAQVLAHVRPLQQLTRRQPVVVTEPVGQRETEPDTACTNTQAHAQAQHKRKQQRVSRLDVDPLRAR